MEDLKVLHINSNYLTSKLHENLIEQLDSKGIANTIFMPIKVEKIKEFLYESKYNVINPITFKNYHKYFFNWKQKIILNKLKDSINIVDYHLVHAHTMSTDGNVAYNLKKEYGIPYIVTVRGYTDMRFFKLRVHMRKRGRDILKNASAIIFLSDSSRSELLEHYISAEDLKNEIMSKSLILPNGIDQYWHDNIYRNPREISGNEVNVITVGKVITLKNVLATVKALNHLQKVTNYKFKLTSVGSIVDKKYAEECLREANIIELNILGTKNQEELIKLYRQNDIFVMPSFKETFGLVFPEAMSQGLPVIYPQKQGFDGQFPEGVIGYSANPYNYRDVAEKILDVLNNYETISCETVNNLSKFDWEQISEYYLRLYSEVSKLH